MAVGKISTDTTHRAVPRRQLSFLFYGAKDRVELIFAQLTHSVCGPTLRPSVAYIWGVIGSSLQHSSSSARRTSPSQFPADQRTADFRHETSVCTDRQNCRTKLERLSIEMDERIERGLVRPVAWSHNFSAGTEKKR